MLKLTFFIPNGTARYTNYVTPSCPFSSPTLWEPSDLVLSLVTSFFGRLHTRAKICLTFNKFSFRYHMNMSSFMCKSRGRRLVISSSYHTYFSSIPNPFRYRTMYPSWLVASYYGHTIDNLSTHLLQCSCDSEHIIAHNTF